MVKVWMARIQVLLAVLRYAPIAAAGFVRTEAAPLAIYRPLTAAHAGLPAGQRFARPATAAQRASVARVVAVQGPSLDATRPRRREEVAPRLNNGKFEGEFVVQKGEDAAHLHHRLEMWQQFLRQQAPDAEAPITVTLPNGNELQATAATTPLEIAAMISPKLAESVVIAKVLRTDQNSQAAADTGSVRERDLPWELWDLTRPLGGDVRLELLKFDADEAQEAFWRSSAHLLGAALESVYGAYVTTSGPLDSGFYTDAYTGDFKVTAEEYGPIEEAMRKLVAAQTPFERLELQKDEALELFASNPFQAQVVSELPDGSTVTAYRCGDAISLSSGPHLPHAGLVKALEVLRSSAAYWQGDADQDSLQRVTGVSFPSAKQLKAHQKMLKEAEQFDHRIVGKEQDLFFFNDVSPGSCFWTPLGARIHQKLQDFIRAEYRIRGYQEVVTPNLFSCDLWKTSGHYANYKDDMFLLEVDNEEWGLKPMNCPSHCEIFRQKPRSYRELPWRVADFGVLHRNELRGSLGGLTRVRRFQQDDAHIFCRPDQIKAEVISAMDFLQYVYSLFGFEISVMLSTRPEKAIGSNELWQKAEDQLEDALKAVGVPYGINPGDGAFYGPKIDIQLRDTLGRKHQCGTIQLDFNLPIRFDLQYRTEAGGAVDAEADAGADTDADGALRPGFERPVMVHRAVLGSIERFTAILLEHFQGKLPFWLAPRQVMVIPVSEASQAYAEYVRDQLHNQGFHVDVDTSSDTLGKKVRDAQVAGYCYQAVVGEQEEADWSVTLRERGQKKPLGTLVLPDLVTKLKAENTPQSKALGVLEPWGGSAVPAAATAPAAQVDVKPAQAPTQVSKQEATPKEAKPVEAASEEPAVDETAYADHVRKALAAGPLPLGELWKAAPPPKGLPKPGNWLKTRSEFEVNRGVVSLVE
jgi:threonyl-tRNA synthetase